MVQAQTAQVHKVQAWLLGYVSLDAYIACVAKKESSSYFLVVPDGTSYLHIILSRNLVRS